MNLAYQNDLGCILLLLVMIDNTLATTYNVKVKKKQILFKLQFDLNDLLLTEKKLYIYI